jgi:hypothetical protein
MTQQTAVEWLIEQFAKKGYIGLQDEQQAKAMEKEQIEDAYDQMRCVGNYENGKQYYKETYGSQGSADITSPNIKNK